MPDSGAIRLLTREELASRILFEDSELLAVNKPPGLPCHPSKRGPWSSLVGACREYTGRQKLHMPSRLDRETSGVVVLAKSPEMGSLLQRAAMQKRVRKMYLAILNGKFHHPVTVSQPIGRAEGARVWVRQQVRADGAPSETVFEPLAVGEGITLVRAIPKTGRMHQIRVHASWLGHPVLGDKIYGSREEHFLTFLKHGWTEELEAALHLRNHALHAAEWRCEAGEKNYWFQAPAPAEWVAVLSEAGIEPELLKAVLEESKNSDLLPR